MGTTCESDQQIADTDNWCNAKVTRDRRYLLPRRTRISVTAFFRDRLRVLIAI